MLNRLGLSDLILFTSNDRRLRLPKGPLLNQVEKFSVKVTVKELFSTPFGI